MYYIHIPHYISGTSPQLDGISIFQVVKWESPSRVNPIPAARRLHRQLARNHHSSSDIDLYALSRKSREPHTERHLSHKRQKQQQVPS